MKESWDARIQRARRLASRTEAAGDLLLFYAELLAAQKDIYERFRMLEDWLPSGSLEQDLRTIRGATSGLLRTVESKGPESLAHEARSLLQAEEREIDAMLLNYWRAPSDLQFFSKAFLQPYASWLIETGARPVDRDVERAENRCPYCGGKAQVSFLVAQELEGGGRSLVCSTCLSAWPFRRVVCAGCGEEDPAKLGYFHSPEYDHVRVEACDTCKQYIKGVDLTRLGLAVPLVDEVAAAALDIWARQHGYTKIELNLVGI